MSLTKSLSDYNYIVPAPRGATLDSDSNLNSTACDLHIISTEYFKNNSVTARSLSGASGSIVYRLYVYTYVDDTIVTVNIPSGGDTNPKLYGIK